MLFIQLPFFGVVAWTGGRRSPHDGSLLFVLPPCAVFYYFLALFFLQMSGLLHLRFFQPFSPSSVKGIVHQLKFNPYFILTPVLMESLVAFSDPHTHI